MQFMIDNQVFLSLPEVCFGVVIAHDLDNSQPCPAVTLFLEKAIAQTQARFLDTKPKDDPHLQPYRAAFQALGLNPNKFPSSIEALTSRIAKGGALPAINPAVDLVNAYSLLYTLPMGAHDLDQATGNINVRYSNEGDRFVPFGQQEAELLEAGELVYAVGDTIKTRRWIWRQSDYGKVTVASKNIFFPIDGFRDYNGGTILAVRDQLASDLEHHLKARVTTYFLDGDNRSITF